MEIIYEDKELLVCIKERGLLSQEGSDGQESVPSLLREQCKCEIYPVHRLDKEVGGVMIYAKTKKAAAELSAQVSDRRMEKTYLTVVHSGPEDDEGEMEDLLFFDKSKNKAFTVKRERRGVRKASLSYKVLRRTKDRSLVKIQLHTGRTHQIRVQFASRKMPVFGDRRYGARDESEIIALWSCSVAFIHPVTREWLVFEKESEEAIFHFD